MPFLADDALVAGRAHDAHDLALGLAEIVVGMDEELAKAARERLVAGIVELLIAEEDHQMLEQGSADLGDVASSRPRGDVDTANFSAEGAGYR